MEPIRDPHIAEAMEVCRPGSDDLSDLGLAFLADHLKADPQLRRRFERLQQLDQSVADAFRNVPAPQGLADRILSRMATAAGPEQQAPAPQPMATVPSRGPRVSRRWLVLGAGSIAVAVAVLVAVWIPWTRPKAIDGPSLGQLAIEFFVTDTGQDGELITQVPPPESHPFGFDVQPFSEPRWRWVGSFLGGPAVAYDMTGPAGERATLYVVRRTATNVQDLPSRHPFTTSGCSTSAWQTGPVLYVLVVEGSPRTYQKFLVTPREPLT